MVIRKANLAGAVWMLNLFPCQLGKKSAVAINVRRHGVMFLEIGFAADGVSVPYSRVLDQLSDGCNGIIYRCRFAIYVRLGQLGVEHRYRWDATSPGLKKSIWKTFYIRCVQEYRCMIEMGLGLIVGKETEKLEIAHCLSLGLYFPIVGLRLGPIAGRPANHAEFVFRQRARDLDETVRSLDIADAPDPQHIIPPISRARLAKLISVWNHCGIAPIVFSAKTFLLGGLHNDTVGVSHSPIKKALVSSPAQSKFIWNEVGIAGAYEY